MDEIPTWFARDAERYKHAYDLLMMEQSRERVIEQVVRSGLSDADAAALVDEAWHAGRGDRRGEGRAEIARGAGLVVSGIVAPIFFSALLRPVGLGLIFWGGMLYGIFALISGARKLMS